HRVPRVHHVERNKPGQDRGGDEQPHVELQGDQNHIEQGAHVEDLNGKRRTDLAGRRVQNKPSGAASTILTLRGGAAYISAGFAGAVAQLGERRNRTAEVRGSNPLGSTSLRPSGFGWQAEERRVKGCPA